MEILMPLMVFCDRMMTSIAFASTLLGACGKISGSESAFCARNHSHLSATASRAGLCDGNASTHLRFVLHDRQRLKPRVQVEKAPATGWQLA
eukprot:scaffold15872_cov122-Isochrysis_galbana.AAC.7